MGKEIEEEIIQVDNSTCAARRPEHTRGKLVSCTFYLRCKTNLSIYISFIIHGLLRNNGIIAVINIGPLFSFPKMLTYAGVTHRTVRFERATFNGFR